MKTTLQIPHPHMQPTSHMRHSAPTPQQGKQCRSVRVRPSMRSSNWKNPHSQHPSPAALSSGAERLARPIRLQLAQFLPSSCHLILMQVLYLRCVLTAPLHPHPHPHPPRRRGRIQRAHPPTVWTQESGLGAVGPPTVLILSWTQE